MSEVQVLHGASDDPLLAVFLISSMELDLQPGDVTCSARWWVASLGGGDTLANEVHTEAAEVFDQADFNF